MQADDRPGPRGRLFQHGQFETDQCEGLSIQALVGLSFGDQPDALAPSIVYLSDGGPFWHKIFLDAGAVFWEELTSAEAAADWAEGTRFEVGSELGVVGRAMGAVLAFPESPAGGSGLHIHLDGGDKLVLQPSDAADIDSEARLSLERGSVQETFLELFGVCDEPDHRNTPQGFARQAHDRVVRACHSSLEEKLGRTLVLDDSVQGASFHIGVALNRAAEPTRGLGQGVRFSTFGAMASLADDAVSPPELQTIREVLRQFNFIYVPKRFADLPYDGVLSKRELVATWWWRFFDHT